MSKKDPPPLSGIKKEICFVIMPFSADWFDGYYEEIYCPAISKAGLEPHRADDLFAPNSVVEDIWEYTKKAQIILADLTGKNPNVFYELGLAHAIAKPVILVTESDDDIPFDLKAIRILKYDKNKHDWGEQLKKSITQSITEILKNPEASVPSPFLKTSREIKGSTVSPAEKELITIKQDLELIRKQLHSTPTNLRENKEREVDIGPEKARELIKDYISMGFPLAVVVKKLTGLGPPPSWIKRQFNLFTQGPGLSKKAPSEPTS